MLKRRPQAEDVFPETREEILAEIEELTERNRADPSRDTERRLLKLRHVAGIHVYDTDWGDTDFASPDTGRLPGGPELPEFAPADLSAELLRAGILRDGCVLVRGLVDRDAALHLAQQIDRAFAVRAQNGGVSHSPDEHSTPEDVALAIDVLTDALDRLASA